VKRRQAGLSTMLKYVEQSAVNGMVVVNCIMTRSIHGLTSSSQIYKPPHVRVNVHHLNDHRRQCLHSVIKNKAITAQHDFSSSVHLAAKFAIT